MQVVKQLKQFPFFPIVKFGKSVGLTFSEKSLEHEVGFA